MFVPLKKTLTYYLIIIFLWIPPCLGSENTDNAFPVQKIVKERHLQKISKYIEKRNTSYLKRIRKCEEKIFRKLCRENEPVAEYFYLQNFQKYSYTYNNSNLDSLTALYNLANLPDETQDLRIMQLQNNKQIIKNRKRKKYLQELSSNYPVIKKDVKKYNKLIFYYQDQVKQNDLLIKKAKFINKKRFDKLAQLPEYTAALDKLKIPSISELLPGDLNPMTQSNLKVSERIAEKQDIFNFNKEKFDEVVNEVVINGLKVKALGLSNFGDLPAFKPNPYKNQLFKDRIEFAYSFQNLPSQRMVNSGPAVGINLTYKITHKFECGIGIDFLQPIEKEFNINKFGYSKKLHSLFKINKKINITLLLSHNKYKYYRDIINNVFIDENYSFLMGGGITPTKSKITLYVYYDFNRTKYSLNTFPIIFKLGRTLNK